MKKKLIFISGLLATIVLYAGGRALFSRTMKAAARELELTPPHHIIEVGVPLALCEVKATWHIPPGAQKGYGQYDITIETPLGDTFRRSAFNYQDDNVVRIKLIGSGPLIESGPSETEILRFTMDDSNRVADP